MNWDMVSGKWTFDGLIRDEQWGKGHGLRLCRMRCCSVR